MCAHCTALFQVINDGFVKLVAKSTLLILVVHWIKIHHQKQFFFFNFALCASRSQNPITKIILAPSLKLAKILLKRLSRILKTQFTHDS